MRRSNQIKLVMKFLTKLILIQWVLKRLKQFLLIHPINFHKKAFNFIIIIFLPLFMFKNPQYLYLSYSIECEYWILSYHLNKISYLKDYILYRRNLNINLSFISISHRENLNLHNNEVGYLVNLLMFDMIWKTGVNFTC